MFDLVLKGGRILDPGSGVDRVADIAFADGKVAAIGDNLSAKARTSRDAAGHVVVPGLVDFHAHVWWGGTYLSVEAERVAKASGTTTFVDAGSAGAGTWHGFRRFVIDTSALRIKAFLNISHPGIYGYGPGFMIGEAADLALLRPETCLKVALSDRERIIGIKVRLGSNVSGHLGLAPLDLAIEVAEAAELPVMVHLGPPPPSRRDILERLRPGDVLTHCCKSFPSALTDRRGLVREEAEEARRRGILFDVGHGRSSFGFDAAKAMVEQDWLPDIISSDVHVQSIDGPAFDVLVTMSKFLCLGVSLPEVVRRATVAPAAFLSVPGLGTLAVGAPGDAVVIEERAGSYDYVDFRGTVFRGDKRLYPQAIVVKGALWP